MSQMTDFLLQWNVTYRLYDADPQNQDFFANIYATPLAAKISIVMLNIMGFFGCIGLSFIVWFEISGEAGPFRTVINQLVSFNFIEVGNKCHHIMNPIGNYEKLSGYDLLFYT